MNRTLLFFIICFAAAFSPEEAAGQFFPTTAVDSTEIKQADSEKDPLGRDTPRGTVGGFFKALSNDDYSRASKFVDFSTYSESRNDSAVTAMIPKMEKLLDRYGTSTPLSVLSSKAEGNLEDGLASDLDDLGTLRMKDKREVMYLARIPSEDGGLWLISSQTTDMLIQYISTDEEEYALDDTIGGFWQSRWKGAAIKDWILTIVLGIGSYLLAWVLTFFLRWIILSVWKSLRYNKYGEFLQTLIIPLRLVVMIAILTSSVRAFEISIIVRQAFGPVYLIILLTALFIFIWLLINSLSSYGEQRLRERRSFGGLSAISFFRNSAKFSLVIIAILIAFDTIGLNITAGLAALGVGGIALALGAQKTVENLVGGLSVVFDQPVN
jgi:MscS family membrane protein